MLLQEAYLDSQGTLSYRTMLTVSIKLSFQQAHHDWPSGPGDVTEPGCSILAGSNASGADYTAACLVNTIVFICKSHMKCLIGNVAGTPS